MNEDDRGYLDSKSVFYPTIRIIIMFLMFNNECINSNTKVAMETKME